MKDLIRTVSSGFRFFRQPHKIGDTLEVNGTNFIIIGIEKFEVGHKSLRVWYTVQNLDISDYISKKKAYKSNFELEGEAKVKFDNEALKTKLYLGSIHFIKGNHYKLLEYTDIKFDSTDLRISFIMKPVHPLDRKEAKAKLIDTRKKKLQFEVL